jgi:NRAMP (natural resistance-associated macrophage protein)-like metal ion transporter
VEFRLTALNGSRGGVLVRRSGRQRRDPRDERSQRSRLQPHRFLKILGPGLITGASDDDPSGIGTYAMAGASLGVSTLWTALVTFPMMAAIQFICAKIALVTDMGLAGVLRAHYPRAVLYPVVAALVVANTINAGVDIGAMAAALSLVSPLPSGLWIVSIPMTILSLQVWGSYRLIARTFKWLTLALFAYIGSTFYAKPDLWDMLRGTFIPTLAFDAHFMTILVAILGTTISPYLFFRQASQEVEERMSVSRRRLRWAGADVVIGMLFSNVVMYFVILATAATLFRAGTTDIQSAAEAAEALRPIAGDAAYVLFAVGIIGSGFLAVPILTASSAYAAAEALGARHGLDQRPRRAKLFYGVIIVPTLIGMLMNFIGINAMKALFWTAVINGFLAPPLLVVIMLVANNRQVMGRWTNGIWENAAGWATTAVMFAAAIGLVLTWGAA